MSRGADQQGQDARNPLRATDGVVRTAKPIPSMVKSASASEPRPSHGETMELPCLGRCGHCECHPCRLHGAI